MISVAPATRGTNPLAHAKPVAPTEPPGPWLRVYYWSGDVKGLAWTTGMGRGLLTPPPHLDGPR